MNNFFGMLSRMKYINRWGLMRNTITENIAEHSLDVAIIAHALANIGNVYFDKKVNEEHVAVLAIFHDTTEIITGDLPTPIKYFAPEIRDSYKNIEKIAADQLISELPEEMQKIYMPLLHEADGEVSRPHGQSADGVESPPQLRSAEGVDDWKYVKAADKLSAYIKCIDEAEMGNHDFEKAQGTLLQTLKDMQMPEVDFFLEKFIESYSITLDEINK